MSPLGTRMLFYKDKSHVKLMARKGKKQQPYFGTLRLNLRMLEKENKKCFFEERDEECFGKRAKGICIPFLC